MSSKKIESWDDFDDVLTEFWSASDHSYEAELVVKMMEFIMKRIRVAEGS